VDGYHTGLRVKEGQDVGWHKKHVGGLANHLPGETQVGPKAREGHSPQFEVSHHRKKPDDRRTIKVEAVTMATLKGQEMANQIKGVVFCPRAFLHRRPAGVNSNEHLVQVCTFAASAIA